MVKNMIEVLKEEISTKGRKTIKKHDIKECLSKEKENYWEV